MTSATHAPLRTFKLRRGRVTPTQADAIARLSSVYAVPLTDRPLEPVSVFGRRAPVVLDVGFGMGEATAELAAADPHRDVLAVDLHTPGIGNLLKLIEAAGLTNVRIVEGDARDVLARLPGEALDEVRVFFPDPWPKARHRKRRLVTPAFCGQVASRLGAGGRLHLATDWAPYAEQMRAALASSPGFRIVHDVPWRPRTRFERQGIAAGRPAQDVVAVRC